jgi:hypothetical protein
VTGAVLDRPISHTERPLLGGRVTLEERLDAVLHAARTNGSAECPLCHARMTPTAADAACDSCGSHLS